MRHHANPLEEGVGENWYRRARRALNVFIGACTNDAESFLSRVRLAEIGIHHHIAGPYFAEYLGLAERTKICLGVH